MILSVTHAIADVPCAGIYEQTTSSIVSARVGRGLEMKLLTKVTNAWRIYGSGRNNAQRNALHELDVALGLLDKNSTKQLPPDVRNAVVRAISDFRRCIEGTDVTTATLTVKVMRPGIGNSAPSVVADAIVRVNGAEVATTSATGTATVSVPAGPTAVQAVVYPMEAASATVNAAAGTSSTLTLLLADSEAYEPTTLALDEAPEGALNATFTTFTLRFVDADGNRVPMRSIEDVQLLRADEAGYTYWGDSFAVAPDGSLQPRDLAAWRNVLRAQSGKLELTASAIDTRGRAHAGRLTFYLGSLILRGVLAAPPSNPSLNVGDINVLVTVLNTGLVFRTVTAGDGSFTITGLPRGNVEVDAQTTEADGKQYYGDAVVTLSSNVTVKVNMLFTTDKINGVPLFTIIAVGNASARCTIRSA